MSDLFSELKENKLIDISWMQDDALIAILWEKGEICLRHDIPYPTFLRFDDVPACYRCGIDPLLHGPPRTPEMVQHMVYEMYYNAYIEGMYSVAPVRPIWSSKDE